jgi:hypothetical protein
VNRAIAALSVDLSHPFPCDGPAADGGPCDCSPYTAAVARKVLAATEVLLLAHFAIPKRRRTRAWGVHCDRLIEQRLYLERGLKLAELRELRERAALTAEVRA